MGVYSESELDDADLIVDAVYEGVAQANGSYADPLNRLVHVSSRGGFRYRGTKDAPTLVVLTSSLAEPDWPDELDATTGRFVYYGDNREPGRELHATGRFGNHLLRVIFDRLHLGQRHLCPPVLVFTSLRSKRAFTFRGLAVPQFAGVPPTQDLVAVWKSSRGHRFQNYRAVFTILDLTFNSALMDQFSQTRDSKCLGRPAVLENVGRDRKIFRPSRPTNPIDTEPKGAASSK